MYLIFFFAEQDMKILPKFTLVRRFDKKSHPVQNEQKNGPGKNDKKMENHFFLH